MCSSKYNTARKLAWLRQIRDILMKIVMCKRSLAFLLGLMMSLSVYGETIQSLTSIEQAAYVYGLAEAQAQYDNPQITMEALDSRLRLQACSSELEAFSNTNNTGLGNQTIGIKCHAPVMWTVYVPIKIRVFKSVVVAVKPLAAKQIISKSDIRLEQQDIATMRQGFMEDTDLLVGQQLKYPVATGTVIKPNNLTAQKSNSSRSTDNVDSIGRNNGSQNGR